MSELRHTPPIPDTMPYTQEEKELARQKQKEATDGRNRKRKRVIASIAGGAVILAGGGTAFSLANGGDKAPSKSEQGVESAENTITIKNTAGETITVPTREGMPYTDNNGDDINDFEQDTEGGVGDGTFDGFQYSQEGTYVEDVVNDPNLGAPVEALPINNDLTDAQVNNVIELGDLLSIYPNAYNIVRSLPQEVALEMTQWIDENAAELLTEGGGGEIALQSMIRNFVNQ